MLPRLAIATLLLAGSAMAAPVIYYDNLSGPNEAPANSSPGTGFARVTIDTVANTMRVEIVFSGLTGTTTASHIHCCTATPGTATAGVATVTPTFTGFPNSVSAGSYDFTYNTEGAGTYNAAFVTANGGTFATAEAALATGIAQGRAYVNIHSTTFAGGEIRGFLAPVPEPSTFGLAASALVAAFLYRRKR